MVIRGVARRSRVAHRSSARRRWTIGATALVAVIVLGSLSGAQAAPSVVAAASSVLPPPKGGSDSATYVDGTTGVRKAKMTIRLPRVLLRAYANEVFSIKDAILSSATRAWVVTDPGKHPGFGVFPATRTHLLGFGSVPITATLHLRQIVRHGEIVPITIKTKTQNAPPFETQPTHVTALLDIRVSDVRVDQVPLKVGADCHTATPMHLSLVGISPGYNLFTGGPLTGDQVIPPFTGCGTGGDDLDPLLTGMISGPGNPVSLTQGNLAAWDPSKPNDCNGCLPPNP